MRKNRNGNIEIFRLVAIMLVLIYHVWVLTGSCNLYFEPIRVIIELGGEVGVTAFFVLSGYSIFTLLKREEYKGRIVYSEYIKKRIIRIAPAYYICLLVSMIISNGAVYIGHGMWKNLLLHFLFLHNFVPGYAGAINGALWTMGLTVQFYIIAVLVYRFINKHPILSVILFCSVTVLFKVVTFKYLLPRTGMELSFWFSRQLLPSVLDNFAIGMFAARLSGKQLLLNRFTRSVILVFVLCLIIFTGKIGMMYGIYTNNVSGYSWHSVIAIEIGALIWLVASLPNVEKGIGKMLIKIASYEYQIYLWHLVIINQLIEKAPFFHNGYAGVSFIIKTIAIIIMSVFVAIVFDYAEKGLVEAGSDLKHVFCNKHKR